MSERASPQCNSKGKALPKERQPAAACTDLVFVHVLESLADLSQHVGRVVLGVVAIGLLLDAIEQLTAGAHCTNTAQERKQANDQSSSALHALRLIHSGALRDCRSPDHCALWQLRAGRCVRVAGRTIHDDVELVGALVHVVHLDDVLVIHLGESTIMQREQRQRSCPSAVAWPAMGRSLLLLLSLADLSHHLDLIAQLLEMQLLIGGARELGLGNHLQEARTSKRGNGRQRKKHGGER